jgi:hypothetical protein
MGGWAAGLPILAPEETAASPSGLRCEALAGLCAAGHRSRRTLATAHGSYRRSNFQSDLIGLDLRSRFCPAKRFLAGDFVRRGCEVRHLFFANNSLFRRGYLGRRPPQLPHAKKRVISEKQVPKNGTASDAFLNLTPRSFTQQHAVSLRHSWSLTKQPGPAGSTRARKAPAVAGTGGALLRAAPHPSDRGLLFPFSSLRSALAWACNVHTKLKNVFPFISPSSPGPHSSCLTAVTRVAVLSFATFCSRNSFSALNASAVRCGSLPLAFSPTISCFATTE